MNLIKIKRIIFKPFFESRIKNQVEKSFKLRNIIEIVRKREEFKLKLLEAKKVNIENNVNKYKNFIEVLNWIIINE
jgi:hypothetical protein